MCAYTFDALALSRRKVLNKKELERGMAIGGHVDLLREIEDAAVASDTPVSELLRKCKVLGTRLQNEELKAWAELELNGYPDDQELPDYRVHGVESLGHFSGVAGSSLKNAPIPPSNIPKEYREIATTAYMREPIKAVEDLLAKDSGVFTSPWPNDLIKFVQSDIYSHMNLVQAWRQIPRGAVVALVDTVRNRILNFVLEISSEANDATSPHEVVAALGSDRITQVFHTYISGPVGNLALASPGSTQQSTVVRPGDRDSLEAALASLGVSAEDITSLDVALAEDSESGKKGIGGKVGAWLGSMVAKASTGALAVSAKEASKSLTELLLRYLGVDS